MVDPVLTLKNISIAPAQQKAFEAWLEFSDALGFLKENATDDEFVFYAGTTHAFMRVALATCLPLTDSATVWTFHDTRHQASRRGGRSSRRDITTVTKADISCPSHTAPAHASYMRGFQIVRTSASTESIIKRLG